MKIRFLLVLFLFIGFCLQGNIIPKDSTTLNYTHVVFEYPPIQNAFVYEIFFYKNNQVDPFHSQRDSTHITFCCLFEFGNSYRWNYIAYNKQMQAIFKSPQYSFSIANDRAYDTASYDNLVRGSYQNNGLYLIDQTRNIITSKGQELWRMPILKNLSLTSESNMRDLRMTKSGTFTVLIAPSIAIEFDKDGNILWMAPHSTLTDTNQYEKYHHDFRKLNKGTFMVMSETEGSSIIKVSKEQQNLLLKSQKIKLENNTLYYNDVFGTLIEYSTNGEVLWKWSSKDFLTEQVLDGWIPEGPHSNAFFFDEVKKHIYFGFKNLGLILKIEYPSGKVIKTFGLQLSNNQLVTSQGVFAQQHSIEIIRNGNILIFNNDSCDLEEINSSLVVLNEQSPEKDKLVKKVSCRFDNQDDGKAFKYGSAEELPDGNILLGIGAKGRVVVLDPRSDYELLQDVSLKVYRNGQWDFAEFYRCHFAESFYPCYFSVTRLTESIRISNEGSSNDEYSVLVIGKNGSKRIYRTPMLKTNQKYELPINFSDVKSVDVTSVLDNRVTRKLSF